MTMKKFPVCAVSEIGEGKQFRFELDGREFMICNRDGNFHAVDGVCPHRGALLIQGDVSGTTVSCPWHGWEFDIVSGEGMTNPSSSLCKHPVTVENGTIFIELDEDKI